VLERARTCFNKRRAKEVVAEEVVVEEVVAEEEEEAGMARRSFARMLCGIGLGACVYLLPKSVQL
jgi:hypothetical protein